MWGTPGLTVVRDPTLGIIPTYVGNTLPLEIWRQLTRDHPYVCGEHTKEMLIYQHFRFAKSQFFISFNLYLEIMFTGHISK